MKKVNLNVKKVIAAGLIVSLLMPSLGNTNCFANEPEILYAQREKCSPKRTPVLKAEGQAALRPKRTPALKAEEHSASVPKVDDDMILYAKSEKSRAKKEKIEHASAKKSKKQIAKTAGKVLLAVAAVGATGYLIYKSRGYITRNSQNSATEGSLTPFVRAETLSTGAKTVAGNSTMTGEIAPYVAEKETEAAVCGAKTLLTGAKTVAENNAMTGEITPYVVGKGTEAARNTIENSTPLRKFISKTVIRGTKSACEGRDAKSKTIWETTKTAGKITAGAAKLGWSGAKTAGKITVGAAKLGWSGAKTAGKITTEAAKLGWSGAKTAGKITTEAAKLGWSGTKFAYTHRNGLAKCSVGVTSAIGTGIVINKVAEEIKKLEKFATKAAQNTKKVITAPYRTVKSIANIPSELLNGAANVYVDTCKVYNTVRHPIDSLKAAWRNSCNRAKNPPKPKSKIRYVVTCSE